MAFSYLYSTPQSLIDQIQELIQQYDNDFVDYILAHGFARWADKQVIYQEDFRKLLNLTLNNIHTWEVTSFSRCQNITRYPKMKNQQFWILFDQKDKIQDQYGYYQQQFEQQNQNEFYCATCFGDIDVNYVMIQEKSINFKPDQNILKTISHIKFLNLNLIDLRNNNIDNIESLSFLDCANLKYLVLSDNKITKLNAFSKCVFERIKSVNLRENKFNTSQLNVFHRYSIKNKQKTLNQIKISSQKSLSYSNPIRQKLESNKQFIMNVLEEDPYRYWRRRRYNDGQNELMNKKEENTVFYQQYYALLKLQSQDSKQWYGYQGNEMHFQDHFQFEIYKYRSTYGGNGWQFN